MILEVYTYAQTYQILYFKYVEFTVFQLYLNKVVKKKTPQAVT